MKWTGAAWACAAMGAGPADQAPGMQPEGVQGCKGALFLVVSISSARHAAC
jgi:hypothetical protein